jgi:hypothetical protein
MMIIEMLLSDTQGDGILLRKDVGGGFRSKSGSVEME